MQKLARNQTFLDAMPITKEKVMRPNHIGHQSPIAQPGINCQIEFRLIQLTYAERLILANTKLIYVQSWHLVPGL
jgi:hypothetical protein